MSKIIHFLIFFFCFIFIFSITNVPNVYGQSQQVKLCDNPQVQVEPLERSRKSFTGPLLSDDLKAEFTIDVNREANESASNIKEWYMEWQCSVAVGPVNLSFQKNKALDSPGEKKIYSELDNQGVPIPGNTGTFVNRCEFDPKTNPVRIRVKAKLNNGTETDWCDATYQVTDADRLCKLDLKATKGDINKIIFGQTELEVTGTDLTKNGAFILLLDGQPIWTIKGTLNLPIPFIGPQIDFNRFNLNSPPTPDFPVGGQQPYKIENKYLTRDKHVVSLHRITRNFANTIPLIGRSINDLIEHERLCSVLFTVGDASNPGGITSREGGTITTQPRGILPCVGIDCSSSGGQPCDTDGIATAIGCIHTAPAALVKDVLKFLIGISGGIALLLMALGAFGMITSAGNPESLQAGKDRFTQAIIGLLFIVFSVLLLKVIGVDILGLGKFFGI